MTLDTLIGKKVTLVAYSNDLDIQINRYGSSETASCTFLKYKFNGELHILKICVEPCDVYRNNLGEVKVVDYTDEDYQKAVFTKLPPAKVILEHNAKKRNMNDGWTREQDVYEFVDINGTVWFTFGTDNSDDYYPSYICYPNEIDLKKYRDTIIGDILDDE